jgi:flagellar protein FliO/FliZ
MRALLPVLVVVVAPGAASAAEKGGDGYSPMAGFFQMLASLALVIGLILVFYFIANRWLKTGRGTALRSRHIRLVETHYLAPKKSLLLMEVGGEYLLLSDSGERVQFIKQVTLREEVAAGERGPYPEVVPGGGRGDAEALVTRLRSFLAGRNLAELKEGLERATGRLTRRCGSFYRCLVAAFPAVSPDSAAGPATVASSVPSVKKPGPSGGPVGRKRTRSASSR